MNMEEGHGDLVEGNVFALKSWTGNALLFWVMLEDGALYDKIPISAFCWKKDAEHQPHYILQLWNCFSYQPHVSEFQMLKGKKCRTILRDGSLHLADYMFTVDWSQDASETLQTGFAEIPQEHKCAHILQLENGNFAAQPNNRILWADPGFVMKPFGARPNYKLNEQEYLCENIPKWVSEDSDIWQYAFQEVKKENDPLQTYVDNVNKVKKDE